MKKLGEAFRTLFSLKSAEYRRYTRNKFGNFMYVAFLVAFAAFSVLPLVYCIATSFKPMDELLIFPPSLIVVKRPTLQNYAAIPGLLSNLRIPLSRYIFNSVIISVVSTLGYILVSSMAAFSLSKSTLRGNKVIFSLVQYALLFNGYTLAIPQFLIFSALGMIDTYSIYIIPSLASTMGVFLMKQYMEGSIPGALMEAARIDGAGPFRTFFQIAFPLVKPCVMTLLLFGFLGAWGTTGGGTIFSESIKTLPTIMGQIMAGGLARAGSSMAVSVIMMTPPIVVYLISQSNVLKSMNSAGIKE